MFGFVCKRFLEAPFGKFGETRFWRCAIFALLRRPGRGILEGLLGLDLGLSRDEVTFFVVVS